MVINIIIYAYFRNVLRRLEKTGRSEDTDEDHDEKRLSRRSEHILVDGSPGVQAKEVAYIKGKLPISSLSHSGHILKY